MRYLFRISTAFIIIIFVLGLVELSLRMFWTPDFLNPKFKRDDLGWASKNVILNRFGYRDRDFKILKDQDSYRIYVLGDSFTYGWYIDNVNDSLPKILEQELVNLYPKKKIEVINALRPGYGIDEKLERLKNQGIIFSPDVFIMAINLDDFSKEEHTPKYINNKFIKDLRIYQATIGNIQRANAKKLNEAEIVKTFEDNGS